MRRTRENKEVGTGQGRGIDTQDTREGEVVTYRGEKAGEGDGQAQQLHGRVDQRFPQTTTRRTLLDRPRPIGRRRRRKKERKGSDQLLASRVGSDRLPESPTHSRQEAERRGRRGRARRRKSGFRLTSWWNWWRRSSGGDSSWRASSRTACPCHYKEEQERMRMRMGRARERRLLTGNMRGLRCLRLAR